MPRISADIQNCVIYLYRSMEDAWAGRRAGGSGFVLALGSATYPERRWLYAITNSRVIKSGFPVIRTDAINQDMSPFEKGTKDWVHHPGGEDVAACLLGLASDYPQVCYYSLEHFLTREVLDQLGVGIGSDVFLMGRHITLRDVHCPEPVARFGKLAMRDRQFIGQPDGQSRECFVVAVFEPGEHSGAPVFVHSDHPSDGGQSHGGGGAATPWLLGVDQGHLQRYRPVISAQGESHPRGWKVPTPNGLIAVTPAWKLRELLGAEKLNVTKRELELKAGRTLEGGVHDPGRGRGFTGAVYLKALKLVSRKIGTVIPAIEERSTIGLPRTQVENESSYSLEDLRRDFPDKDACLKWLVDYKNPDGIHCRKCQDKTPHARVASRRSYSCARCGHHMHPTVGTIYFDSRLPLHLWFEAIYWIAAAGDRITATKLEQELSVNYKTACRMLNKIRNVLSKNGT